MIYNPMDKAEAKQLLPKVGEKRMEYPTIDESNTLGFRMAEKTPQPCTVIEVHPGRLWYRVRFDNGIVECYKVPKWKPLNGGPAR